MEVEHYGEDNSNRYFEEEILTGHLVVYYIRVMLLFSNPLEEYPIASCQPYLDSHSPKFVINHTAVRKVMTQEVH